MLFEPPPNLMLLALVVPMQVSHVYALGLIEAISIRQLYVLPLTWCLNRPF
jgi:hypothetical protein